MTSPHPQQPISAPSACSQIHLLYSKQDRTIGQLSDLSPEEESKGGASMAQT
jgi:hypothetical protein